MPRRSKFYDPAKAVTPQEREKAYPGIQGAKDYALRIKTAELELLSLYLAYGREGIETFLLELDFTIGDKYALFTPAQQRQLASELDTSRANKEAQRWSADIELNRS